MYLMYHFGFNFPRPPSRIFSMLVCQVRGETLVQPVSRSTDIVEWICFPCMLWEMRLQRLKT